MIHSRFILFLLIVGCFSCFPKKNLHIELTPLFSDHMVIQRDRPFHIWGKATAGEEISVSATWANAQQTTTTSDTQGKWSLEMPAPAAGGPYEIYVSIGDSVLTIEDVLVGEVWLASGQSNMEMPLKGWPPRDTINNSAEEIAHADNPEIRMLTVQHAISFSEQEDFTGSWIPCAPEDAAAFSASAYFFARDLYEELGVPIGIIHSSWGGTPAEAWTSKQGLSHLPDFKDSDLLSLTAEEQRALDHWDEDVPAEKLGAMPIAKIDLGDGALKDADFDDNAWESMTLPTLWEKAAIGQFDGVVWYRTSFEINDLSGEATLSLGPIDDMDVVYVNGEQVGSTLAEGQYAVDRVYKIAASILKAGSNSIAIKVLDTGGGGGLYGEATQLFVSTGSEKVNLAGEWKYLPVAEYRSGMVFKYGVDNVLYQQRPALLSKLSPYTPMTLYNGMIAPIIEYTFQGAIWYQGESNVGRAKQYEALFPEMISDWRSKAGREFPFYFVQIAPFGYRGNQSNQSAALRDAQRHALAAPNTGMVVTLDIGNPMNIHPGNKQAVGSRLALWALSQVYQKDLIFSGPLPQEATFGEDRVRIRFLYTGKGLVLNPSDQPAFELAGADGIFYPAVARIEANRIVVISPKVSSPTAVRYAWSDTAAAVLYNEEGLPASSFLMEETQMK